ncbi:MAG: molybdopterin-dependent oxidoreductase [Candidatus Korarchaeota archaeon]|nr:molybdopterin-dependent oxidoreductase [Candidatus Korarchaeota archaeon]
MEDHAIRRREFLRLVGLGTIPLLLSDSARKVLALDQPKRYGLGEIGHKDLEAAREVRGVCAYCAVGCGIIFYKVGDRVVHVEGDPDNPINEGKLCPKGQASIELFGDHNPRRLRTPMIRVNPKPPLEELKKVRSQEELRAVLEKYKPTWKPVTWEDAFEYISRRIKEILDEVSWSPRQSDGYYYLGKKFPVMIEAGAKLTNEEAYIIKKMAALMGSHNIDHDARRCHSTTVAGLAGTVGFGAQTQTFIDTQFISAYLIFGGNPAEAHPVSMRHTLRGKEKGTLKLIVVDPRYNRTASQADIFAFFRPGSDLAFLLYILHYAFWERNPPVDQLDTFKEYAQRFNVDLEEINEFKEIAKEYTAEEVSRITGIPVEKLRLIAQTFVENSGVTTGFKKFASIQWAMGMTQHHIGTQITRLSTLVQLTLGNMGFPGGGLNPYRGHSNVQGTTDMCILSHILPGYIKQPSSTLQIRVYQDWKNQGFPDAWNWEIPEWAGSAFGPNEKGKVNSTKVLWSWWFHNWRKFELTWGIFVGTDPESDPQNGTVISDIPFGAGYTENTWWQGALFDDVIKAAIIMAENPAVSNADTLTEYMALASLKLLVVVDLWETETATFADVLLPGAVQYEKYGSITNSNRWLQWQDRVVPPPGDAKPDLWIMLKLWEYLRKNGVVKLPSEVYGKSRENVLIKNPKRGEFVKLYERRVTVFMDYASGRYPDPDYAEADPELVYREIDIAVDLYNGMYDWVRHKNLSKRRIPILRSEDQIDGILDRIYLMHKDWGWSWPKNVRILYNLWTLSKTLERTVTYRFPAGRYAVGPELDGQTVTITGETGEIRDSKTGDWRPAFIPGHNFLIGKFYKRAWSGKTDIFTGAVDPWRLLYDEEVVGKFVIFDENGDYRIVDLEEMGVRYPIAESFYYDPEVVFTGKASYKKPFFKGTKDLGDGRVVKYVGYYEWRQVKDAFSQELAQLAQSKGLKEAIIELKGKYGEWYAYPSPGNPSEIWAWDMRYPIHYEPAETICRELAYKYPAMAWRRAENFNLISPPKEDFRDLADTVNLTPEEMRVPEGAEVVVATTNRMVEHFHTGQLTRNLKLLAELVPEPFVEIPKPLADRLGIKPGDIVEVGNNRNRIYLRAMVTNRVPKLKIGPQEKEYFVVNMPWHWGWAGAHSTYGVVNTVSGIYMDTVTTMQETKTFLVYLRKASPDKYDYRPGEINTQEVQLGR